MQPFAVFAIAPIGDKFAATTRTDGTLGFPGGKIDLNESPIEALKREMGEEGWQAQDASKFEFISEQPYEGKLIHWYSVSLPPTKLDDYKEKYRGIKPVLKSFAEMYASGMRNDKALDDYKVFLNITNEQQAQ